MTVNDLHLTDVIQCQKSNVYVVMMLQYPTVKWTNDDIVCVSYTLCTVKHKNTSNTPNTVLPCTTTPACPMPVMYLRITAHVPFQFSNKIAQFSHEWKLPSMDILFFLFCTILNDLNRLCMKILFSVTHVIPFCLSTNSSIVNCLMKRVWSVGTGW